MRRRGRVERCEDCGAPAQIGSGMCMARKRWHDRGPARDPRWERGWSMNAIAKATPGADLDWAADFQVCG